MKRLFLASVGLVALGLGAPAAFAADKRVPAYSPPPPVPVSIWSGCYLGASAGSSSGRSTHLTTAGSTLNNPAAGVFNVPPAGANITDSFNLSGFLGGFQGGCNYQAGVWVFGVEVDGSATNKEGQAFENAIVPPFGGVGRGAWVSQTQERWLVTARGRLGWTIWDKSMMYVTGGGAWAKIDASEFIPGAPIFSAHQESNTRGGWTVGGGLEYALGYGWSAKTEYLYVDFGTFQSFTRGPFATDIVFPRDVKLHDHIVRAGLNYKFW